MRTLHVHSGNIFGGVERILIALAGHGQFNSAVEHQFALCFEGRLAEELRNTGAAVHRLPETRLSNPLQLCRARAQLRALLNRLKCDLAIVHSAWSLVAFGGVLRAAGLPLLFWLHTKTKADSLIERAAQLRFPDAIISVSHSVGETAAHLFPGVPNDVLYSPLALDAKAFSTVDRAALRRSLGASETDAIILQASRMEAWKGHRELLAALAMLSDVNGWQCWIAGGSESAEEISYANEIHALARALGLQNRVHFLGRRSDIPALLTAADIYAQANTQGEGFSIAFMEAAYAGLPIITTALGGALEIVDARTGIPVRARDPKAFATGLRTLIENSELRRALGNGARTRVLNQCDPRRQFAALEKVFAQTVAHHG